MGTVIQLSNHSPYAATEYHPEIYDSFGKLNLTNTYTIVNDDGVLKGLITHGDIAKSYMDAADNTILAKARPTFVRRRSLFE